MLSSSRKLHLNTSKNTTADFDCCNRNQLLCFCNRNVHKVAYKNRNRYPLFSQRVVLWYAFWKLDDLNECSLPKNQHDQSCIVPLKTNMKSPYYSIFFYYGLIANFDVFYCIPSKWTFSDFMQLYRIKNCYTNYVNCYTKQILHSIVCYANF